MERRELLPPCSDPSLLPWGRSREHGRQMCDKMNFKRTCAALPPVPCFGKGKGCGTWVRAQPQPKNGFPHRKSVERQMASSSRCARPSQEPCTVQIERLAEKELSEVLSKNRSSQMMRCLALSSCLPVAAVVVVAVVVVGNGIKTIIKTIRTKSSFSLDSSSCLSKRRLEVAKIQPYVGDTICFTQRSVSDVMSKDDMSDTSIKSANFCVCVCVFFLCVCVCGVYVCVCV